MKRKRIEILDVHHNDAVRREAGFTDVLAPAMGAEVGNFENADSGRMCQEAFKQRMMMQQRCFSLERAIKWISTSFQKSWNS